MIPFFMPCGTHRRSENHLRQGTIQIQSTLSHTGLINYIHNTSSSRFVNQIIVPESCGSGYQTISTTDDYFRLLYLYSDLSLMLIQKRQGNPPSPAVRITLTPHPDIE